MVRDGLGRARVPPENGRYLLSGYLVAGAEIAVAIAVDNASLGGPGYALVEPLGGSYVFIGALQSAGRGRVGAALRPPEDGGQRDISDRIKPTCRIEANLIALFQFFLQDLLAK